MNAAKKLRENITRLMILVISRILSTYTCFYKNFIEFECVKNYYYLNYYQFYN